MKPQYLARLVGLCVLFSCVLIAAPTVVAQTKERNSLFQEKERNDFRNKVRQLLREGKAKEAFALAEARVASERKEFGERDEAVIAALDLLAEVHQSLKEYPAARKVREEALDIRIHLYGKDNWRVREARLSLESQDRISRLEPAVRTRLSEAGSLNTGLLQSRAFRRER
ncbi:MAG TPA: tetratricopeptide repeat protein [Gemmataceae bacterium]|nr:tetratricopeptide repeat protein [Gemmataceae bacterium]